MERLYENIGRFIKGVAITVFIIETVCAIIGGIFFFFYFEDAPSLMIALVVTIIAPILAYVGSAFIYAFGELVEKVCIIEGHMTEDRKKANGNTSKLSQAERDENEMKNFKKEIGTYSKKELREILRDKNDLYTPEELKAINAELESRA